MQIISKKKKKRIGARLGFLWFYMKSLSPADFDIATKLLCELCLELEIPWEMVHEAATRMAETVARVKEDG